MSRSGSQRSQDVTVKRDACGGHGNACERDKGDDGGDDEQLDALSLFVLGVALQVW